MYEKIVDEIKFKLKTLSLTICNLPLWNFDKILENEYVEKDPNRGSVLFAASISPL